MRASIGFLVIPAILLGGCLADTAAPDGEAVAPDSAPRSVEAVSMMEPAGALRLAFDVVEPGRCKMAAVVHQSTDMSPRDSPVIEFNIDEDGLSGPFTRGSRDGFQETVHVGPLDSRDATDPAYQMMMQRSTGTESFGTSLGLGPISVAHRVQILAYAGSHLVAGPSPAGSDSGGGSLRIVAECDVGVTNVTAHEDADALMIGSSQLEGETDISEWAAVDMHQGSLHHVSDGAGAEIQFWQWGTMQGSVRFDGILNETLEIDSASVTGDLVTQDWTVSTGPLDVTYDTRGMVSGWGFSVLSWTEAPESLMAEPGPYPF